MLEHPANQTQAVYQSFSFPPSLRKKIPLGQLRAMGKNKVLTILIYAQLSQCSLMKAHFIVYKNESPFSLCSSAR